MSNLLSSVGVLWIVVGLVAFLAFAYFVPLFVFRIMRNTASIAKELGRLNDVLEGGKALRVEVEQPPSTEDRLTRRA